jgi:predicted transport protein
LTDLNDTERQIIMDVREVVKHGHGKVMIVVADNRIMDTEATKRRRHK